MPRVYPMPFPFLKWAGGKRELFAQIERRLPARIEAYFEPFLGGGAVFFNLWRTGRLHGPVTLADRNPELINLWRQVQGDVEAVIAAASQWENTSECFYAVRALPYAETAAGAARTLWLNRHCYNGLYRLNSKGGFNVPFGKYKTARINAENLRKCAEALQGVRLVTTDFEATLADLPPNAVVYLDPPYAPVSRTSHFNRYDGQPFGEADQRRLAEVFHALPGRGAARAVLSNSDTDLTRALYPSHDIVQMRRPINSKSSARGPVNELLVTLPSQTAVV